MFPRFLEVCMGFFDTVFLFREWAGVSNVIVGRHNKEDETTTVRMVCPHSQLSYVFSILPNGTIEKIELDQFPGQILFNGNPAITTIGEEQNLIVMCGGIHLHIEKAGQFKFVCYRQS